MEKGSKKGREQKKIKKTEKAKTAKEERRVLKAG